MSLLDANYLECMQLKFASAHALEIYFIQILTAVMRRFGFSIFALFTLYFSRLQNSYTT